jgi:hypothetical protein
MKQSDRNEFIKLIVGTAGIFQAFLPAESISLWYDDLICFGLNEIKEALVAFRMDNGISKMPTTGQIAFLIHERKRKKYDLPTPEKPNLEKDFFKKIYEQIKADAPKEPTRILKPETMGDKSDWETIEQIVEKVKRDGQIIKDGETTAQSKNKI